MNISRSVLSVFSSQVVSNVLGILAFVIFANLLSGSEFGIFVLFLAVSQATSALLDLGFDGALEKRISEGDKSVLGTVLALKIGLTFLTSSIIMFFRTSINAYLGGPYALYIIPALVSIQFGRTFMNTLLGELKISFAMSLHILRYVIHLCLGYFLIFRGFGASAPILSFTFAWTIVVLAAFPRLSTRITLPTRDAFWSLFSFAKYNFVPSVLSQRANNWMDILIIGFFLSQIHVAAYEAAWRISMAAMLASTSIAKTIFPQISVWDEEGKQSNIQALIPTALSGSILFIIPAVAGGLLLGNEMLSFLFGREYAIAADALVVLFVGKLFQSANAVLGRILLGTDRVRFMSIAAMIFILANIAMNIVLIWSFGLIGAAVATSLAMGVNAGLLWYYSSRFFVVKFDNRLIISSVAASFGMSVILYLLLETIPVDSLPKLLAIISTGAIIFCIFLLMDHHARKYGKQLIESL